MPNRLLPTVLGVALAIGTASSAYSDNYTAYSTTAESITGNISMDDFSLVFQNGETLIFDQLIADNFIVDGQRVPASVFSVENPYDPELENGNQLCGMGDVTYVANWAAGDGLSAVAVFTGNEPPASSDEMCASYIYQD
ncbi:hypothetical protein HFC70_10675 [Agrobacterium sp. a22-2]|uniref:hypothetical protein n=1 Tax=Agrobacterium sp. a22-2 TaxID=2283840 RepID=UPI0014489803|nr:hypothetical protein [Agrobacterium sp. a22-2]NKN36817.1 hypothetical protein [Agrobacterium sp. a22-2]